MLTSKHDHECHSTHDVFSQLSDDVEEMFKGLSNAPKIRICKATDEMNTRHKKKLELTLRAVDLSDLGISRQTAPEYAQAAYENMRLQERAIGNFCKYKCLNVRGSERKSMIVLVEKLCAIRKSNRATLYSSVAISDRYLKSLVRKGKSAPDLNLLIVTSFFIASKLEGEVVPSGA